MKKIFSIIALLFSLISDAQQIAPGSKSGDTLLYTGFSRFRDIATTTDTTTKKPMGLDANGLSYRMSYWPGSGGVSGVTTMTAFGSTPNANGGTISGVNLTLQPADGSFGGGVSTTTQTLAGAKTFSSALTSSVSTTSPILIGGTGTTSTLQIRPTSNVGASGADIIFQNGNNGGTEIARMLGANGRTGFGTNNPLMVLDITNGTQVTGSNNNNPTVLNVTGVNQALSSGAATMYINSSSAMAADMGGSIAFTALLTTASNASLQNFAIVKGAKLSGVSNNYDGYLQVGVLNHNTGTIIERMKITPNYTSLSGNANQAHELRFYEDTDDGTNYTSFKVGTQAGNVDYTLPIAYPAVTGYVLSSTTGGVMSWIAAGSTETASNGLTKVTNDIQLGGALTANVEIAGGIFYVTHSNTGGTPFTSNANPSSTNTVVSGLNVWRNSSGTPANGIGVSLDLASETISGSSASTSNQIVSKWTDAITASRTSQMIITGVANTSTKDLITIDAKIAGSVTKFDGQIYTPEYTQTYSATTNIDWNNGNRQVVTLTGNVTFTFSNGIAGGVYLLTVKQDATGSRTIIWPTIKWQGGTAPTPTTTANKKDKFSFNYQESDIDGEGSLNF